MVISRMRLRQIPVAVMPIRIDRTRPASFRRTGSTGVLLAILRYWWRKGAHIVGRLNFHKLFVGRLVLVGIWMILLCELDETRGEYACWCKRNETYLVIRLFDIRSRSVLLHTEDVVRILRRCCHNVGCMEGALHESKRQEGCFQSVTITFTYPVLTW
jgi:hypothetical protein